MDVNTRNRAELKSYFVKNSIPTESNFAELIDGMLNQKDDGLVKLPGNPLTIEAAGDANSEKRLLNIYPSFGDQNPAWTLSLNPRQDPNDPATARPGFNISDGEGRSRLFIDRSSGNVGLGTIEPATAKLEVNGSFKATANASGQGEILMESPADGKHRFDPAAEEEESYKTGLVYRVRRNPRGGAPIFQVRSSGQAVRLFVDHDGWTGSRTNSAWFEGTRINYFAGNVGVGTNSVHNPQGWNKVVDILGARHARLNVRSSGGVITSVFSHDNWGGARGAIGTESNHPLTFATNYAHRMVIDTAGNVGIGITNPIAKLDVNSANRTGSHPSAIRGLYITGDFAADSNGVEFRHSNGTQGIGFGYNTIYATGTNANQDLGLKPRGSGVVRVTGTLLADKYVVQNSVNGGSTKGIWMWNANDSNWGIYMGQAGAGRSLAGGAAVAGAGFNSHTIRLRTYSHQSNGLIYENHNEQLNFSVRASDGLTYIRGKTGIGTTNPGTTLEVNGTFQVKNGNNQFYYNGAADVVLKYPGRGSGGRALVHDGSNRLTLNYGNDFSGGVRYYGSLTKASSREIKENIRDFSTSEALEILEELTPLKFNLIGDEDSNLHLGFIAEDVPAQIATADRKAISTDHIVAVLTKVVKEQQQTISSLTEKIQAWES